jgi:hypothetical protein
VHVVFVTELVNTMLTATRYQLINN